MPFTCRNSGLGDSICGPVANLIKYLVDPLFALIAVVAVLIFVVGVVEYLYKTQKGESPDKGKQHILYGLAGLFVIMSTYTIMAVIWNTVKIFFPS